MTSTSACPVVSTASSTRYAVPPALTRSPSAVRTIRVTSATTGRTPTRGGADAHNAANASARYCP